MGKHYVVHSVGNEQEIPIGANTKLKYVGRVGRNPEIIIGPDGIAVGEKEQELDEI